MVQKHYIPRYYVRDSETQELWCLDAKLIAGN